MAATRWVVHPRYSNLVWSVSYLTLSRVEGRFERFDAVVDEVDGALERASVTATVEAASVRSDKADRDVVLRESFLAASEFPRARFSTTRIVAPSKNRYELWGDLTIRDQTRQVTFDVERIFPAELPEDAMHFSGRGSFDRKGYGIHWNSVFDAFPVFIGRQVSVGIDLRLRHARV